MILFFGKFFDMFKDIIDKVEVIGEKMELNIEKIFEMKLDVIFVLIKFLEKML